MADEHQEPRHPLTLEDEGDKIYKFLRGSEEGSG